MPTLDPSHPLAKVLTRDKRYKADAYVFVFEALNYAHDVMGFGQERQERQERTGDAGTEEKPSAGGQRRTERHLTGQQLCEAIRVYALEQYGLLTKAVFNSWGVKSTNDFGNIVFNLIEAKQMRKTKHDSLDDFDSVFDFDEAFVRGFKINAPALKSE